MTLRNFGYVSVSQSCNARAAKSVYNWCTFQDLLDHAIISEQSGRPLEDLPGMSLQQFPYPCSVDDRFILAISRTFPLFMTLSWIYSSAMIIKSIVYEKERRLKETMRVMGLGNLVHWVSWFIDSFVVMMFSSGMLSLLLKVSTTGCTKKFQPKTTKSYFDDFSAKNS